MRGLNLPEEIRKYVDMMKCEENSVGCSQAGVYRFSSDTNAFYLKVDPKTGNLKREYRCLKWLKGRISAPDVICWESTEDMDYLLVSEVKGKMMCDDYYLENPLEAVRILAEGINILKGIDIKECPLDSGLDMKLKEAEERVKLKKVDVDDWEPETGERFSSEEELLEHLKNNQPKKKQLVFTHGDYCLPNIFGEDGKVAGFIDLGDGGVADIWQDVALCIRSLHHNFKTDRYDHMLLDMIGIEMDREKLEYYILLDEVF